MHGKILRISLGNYFADVMIWNNEIGFRKKLLVFYIQRKFNIILVKYEVTKCTNSSFYMEQQSERITNNARNYLYVVCCLPFE